MYVTMSAALLIRHTPSDGGGGLGGHGEGTMTSVERCTNHSHSAPTNKMLAVAAVVWRRLYIPEFDISHT